MEVWSQEELHEVKWSLLFLRNDLLLLENKSFYSSSTPCLSCRPQETGYTLCYEFDMNVHRVHD